MNIEKYYAALKNLDWFYYYCDDLKAYNRGRERLIEMKALAEENGWLDLYEAYKNRVYAYGEVPVEERDAWVEANPYPNVNDYRG
jgi:hypothetical protein